ncbi:MAG: glycosyltransferase family 4 protein [Pseudomonadota bacterium]
MEKGGRTKRILEELRGLEALGHEVRLVCFHRPPDWVLEQIEPDISWRCLEKTSRGVDFGLLRKLRSEVRTFGADVLHSHCEGSALYLGLAAKASRKRCVATVHRSELGFYEPRFKNRLLFRFVDGFIAVSHERRNQMLHGLGIGDRPSAVVHWGVDAESVVLIDQDEARKQLNVKGSPSILSVGHLGPIKGHDDSIEAFSHVVPSFPDAHLYIAGDGSEGDFRRLQDLIVSLGLSDAVTLLGQVNDVSARFDACDIFLQPSREEAFGLVFIEAGIHRKPVIATRIGGIPEIVVDQETGFLVDIVSPEALTAAITRLCNDVDLRLEMGIAAERRISDHFLQAEKVKQLADFLEAVATNRKPG